MFWKTHRFVHGLPVTPFLTNKIFRTMSNDKCSDRNAILWKVDAGKGKSACLTTHTF